MELLKTTERKDVMRGIGFSEDSIKVAKEMEVYQQGRVFTHYLVDDEGITLATLTKRMSVANT